MLYVAGSIQPRALDSKLPLSAVFPLFSLSPQASPRCYLPIVPPSRSCPQPRYSASSSSSSTSSSAASTASASSSRPPCCGSATRSRYNFPNDYYSRVPAIGATSSAQVPRESRGTRRVGGIPVERVKNSLSETCHDGSANSATRSLGLPRKRDRVQSCFSPRDYGRPWASSRVPSGTPDGSVIQRREGDSREEIRRYDWPRPNVGGLK